MEHANGMSISAAVADLMPHYGLWIVFGLIALECMGIPVPGETVLIAAALYAGTTHQLDVASVIAVAAAAAFAGNMVGFWLGREFGYRLLLRYGRYLTLTDNRIKIGQLLFHNHGSKVIFFARFVPVLRSVAAVLAGANCMPTPAFVRANVAGALAWTATIGFGAYGLANEWMHLARPAGISLVALVIAVFIALAVLLARRERDLGAQAERLFPGPLRSREQVRRMSRLDPNGDA
jgi:membrane protein DedA with SNARE-associated domain